MNRFWILSVVLALLLVLLPVVAGYTPETTTGQPEIETPPGVTILKSDITGITLRFDLDEPAQATYTQADVEYTAFKLQDFSEPFQAGAPLLPYQNHMVGVPPGVEVTARVLKQDYEVTDANVLPVPHQNAGDFEFASPVHELYQTSGPVSIVEEGMVRQQRFVNVQVKPVVLDDDGVRIHSTITLRLDFHGRPGTMTSTGDPNFEHIYRDVFINYQECRLWREPRYQTRAMRSSTAPMFKILTDVDGVYELTYSDLQTAGADVGTLDPRTLQLLTTKCEVLDEDTVTGAPTMTEVPIIVEGEDDGTFDPTDRIIFYGAASPRWENEDWVTTPYQFGTVYWLTYGTNNGSRMGTEDGTPNGGSTPTSFRTIVREDAPKTFYEDATDYNFVDRFFMDHIEVGNAPWDNEHGLVRCGGDDDWKDYELTINVTAKRLMYGAEINIMFRVNGPNQFYVFSIGESSEERARLFKADLSNNRQYLQLYTGTNIVNASQEYEIRIKVTGNHIECWRDTIKMVDYYDNSNPWLSGGFGFNGNYGINVYYDDIWASGTDTLAQPFTYWQDFEGYDLRSFAADEFYTLQGTLGECTVRSHSSDQVYESNTDTFDHEFYVYDVDGSKNIEWRGLIYGQPSYNEADSWHHIVTYINDVEFEDDTWDGHGPHPYSFSLTSGDLVDGLNELSVDNPGRTTGDFWDYSYFRYMELDYWRNFEAVNDMLLFNHTYPDMGMGATEYTISDFTSTNIDVFRVTDPFSPTMLENTTTQSTDTIKAGYGCYAHEAFVAVGPTGYLTPSTFVKDNNADLLADGKAADYIMITGDEFYDPADPISPVTKLANHHKADDMRVEVVNITDIYDSFSGGCRDPTAIRNYLYHVYNNWEVVPRYILLFGDASNDYRNIMGYDSCIIPSHLVTEGVYGSEENIASDNWYACVWGADYYPEYVMARIPARTMTDAYSVVNKSIEYETNPPYGDWIKTVAFTADDWTETWEQGFKGNCESFSSWYCHAYNYDTGNFYVEDIGKGAARNALVNMMNSGAVLTQYHGHGQPWGWETFNTVDIQSLTNVDKPTYMTSMGCSTGKFDIVEYQTMLEAIMLEPDKGAIASCGPSRTAYFGSTTTLMNKYMAYLFSDYGRTLGDSLFASKVGGDFYHNHAYTLFGDPALKMTYGNMEMTYDAEYDHYYPGETVTFTGTLDMSITGTAEVGAVDFDHIIIDSDTKTLTATNTFTYQYATSSSAEHGRYRSWAYADDTSTYNSIGQCDYYLTDQLPDFEMKSMWITPVNEQGMIEGKREVTVTFFVFNNGTVATPVTPVEIRVGGTPLNSTDIPILPRETGVWLQLTCNSSFFAGGVQLTAYADPYNVVTELDGNDNTNYIDVDVLLGPDALISAVTESVRYTNVDFIGSASSIGSAPVENVTWDFADGNMSYELDVLHTYTQLGTYNVTLYIRDTNGMDSSTFHILDIVNVRPYAGFTISPSGGDATTTFTFNSTATDQDGYLATQLWDFGDGNTENGPNVTHQYERPGIYTITLNVTDQDGAEAGYEATLTVNNIKPTAVLDVSETTVYTLETVSLAANRSTDIDGEVVNFTWIWGETQVYGPYSNLSFDDDGAYQVTLFVTDDKGKSDTTYVTITVLNRLPTVSFQANRTPIYVDQEVTFILDATDLDGEIAKTSWVFDEYSTQSDLGPEDGIHTFEEAGTYNVTVNVTDDDGAFSWAYLVVEVVEPPEIEDPQPNGTNTTDGGSGNTTDGGSGNTTDGGSGNTTDGGDGDGADSTPIIAGAIIGIALIVLIAVIIALVLVMLMQKKGPEEAPPEENPEEEPTLEEEQPPEDLFMDQPVEVGPEPEDGSSPEVWAPDAPETPDEVGPQEEVETDPEDDFTLDEETDFSLDDTDEMEWD